jgi:hypothetical protein
MLRPASTTSSSSFLVRRFIDQQTRVLDFAAEIRVANGLHRDYVAPALEQALQRVGEVEEPIGKLAQTRFPNARPFG